MNISGKKLLASMVVGVMIASAFAAFLVGGIALAQPQPPCPLDEDFSGSWLPSGWATDDWYQSASSNAGGTSPEATLVCCPIPDYYAYLDSKSIDTTGETSLTLEFKSFIVDYCCTVYGGDDPDCGYGEACGSYECRVYTRADVGDSWTDATPWSNPISGPVGPDTYSINISSDIGNATQVRFEFNGYDYAIQYWAVDDVKICGAGSALPDLVVSMTSVTFDEYGNFTVSYNVTNQGTAPAGSSNTAKYVNGVWQDYESCPSLGPGESHNGPFSSQPCSDFASCDGTFNVTVCADDDGDVDESEETNNCEMNVAECPCPKIVDPKEDTLYLDVDGNAAASAGDILQYIAEIRNEGNATATGVTFSDTVDANTILLCAAPYAAIASQGSITSCTPGAGGALSADLGDIAPGGAATVTFYVRVGYGEFDLVANQGIVKGGNFADDPTDDPDTTEPDDSTDTPISAPRPTPPPGVPTLNHWGIVAMIALFAGLLAWRERRRLSVSRVSD